MRLLFIGHSAGLLGAERSMADIVSGAVSDGHEVTVALPAAGPLVEVLESAGASVAILPMHAWLGTWHWLPPIGIARLLQARLSLSKIEELVHATRAEVVVTNTSVLPTGATAAGRAGVPHIWIVRESLRDNPQLRSALPKRLIARRLLEGADVLCTISPYVEKQLFALAGRGHACALRVSPNPAISESAVVPPAEDSPRVLLLPGFFSPEKGQHRVLLGTFLASRWGSDVRLRLVGRGGPGFTMLLRALVWILRLERLVELVGWTDDLRPEYARSHFVVTASKNEAFGRTVVEAFAHGRPVIGLNRGATEMLLAAGGGLIVQPSTVHELGRVIAAAGEMSPAAYDQLRRRASERGAEFRQSSSQYEAFSVAIDRLAGRDSSIRS